MLKKHTGLFYIAFLFLILAFHHLYVFQGHFGYDDMLYARLAKQFADGNFSVTEDHYTYRWITIFLTGIAYKLLGVTDHASAIMPMLATLFTALLIYFVAYHKGQCVAILAITFYALHYWTFFYSDKIMPDVYVATAVFAALAALYYHRYRASGKNTVLLACVFSAALFTGFLAKETILYMAPVAGFIFLSDVLHKRYLQFWMYCIGSTLILFAGYFGWIYFETGHLLSRFHAIAAGSYLNPCSYDVLPVAVVLKRVAYELWLVFIRSGLAIPILFLIPNLRIGFKKLLAMEDENTFWTTTAAMGLLAANFMSTSYKGYVPMCPDPRHFLFLVPVIAVAAAPVALQYINEGKYKLYLLCSFAVLWFISYLNEYEFTWYTYLPLVVFAVLRLPSSILTFRNHFAYFVLFIVLLFSPILFAWHYSKRNNYFTQKQVVEEHFKNSTKKNIVITDVVQQNFAEYHLEFDSTYTRFITFEQAASQDLSNTDSVYVLLNGNTRYISNVNYDALPAYAKAPAAGMPLLFNYNDVILYKTSAEDVVR